MSIWKAKGLPKNKANNLLILNHSPDKPFSNNLLILNHSPDKPFYILFQN